MMSLFGEFQKDFRLLRVNESYLGVMCAAARNFVDHSEAFLLDHSDVCFRIFAADCKVMETFALLFDEFRDGAFGRCRLKIEITRSRDDVITR